jgi:hypothetical protein
MYYKQVENAIDLNLLEYLSSKYSEVAGTDHVSTRYFNAPATLNGTLPEWHITTLGPEDASLVLTSIINNPAFSHIKKLNRAKVNLHKMSAGTSIALHHDRCMSSITVCLTGDYTGGEFNEVGEDGAVINSMWLDKNHACVYHRPDTAESPGHTVSEITSGRRITLQIFVPGNLNRKD